jgi:Capsule assembly protein Wzi
MKKIFPLLFIAILSLSTKAVGQNNEKLYYDVKLSGVSSTGTASPFLFQSQNYAQTTADKNSLYSNISLGKDFDGNKKYFDISFKVNGLLRTADSEKPNAYLHEYYTKVVILKFLDFTAGAKEEILGTQDSTLSGGGLLFSKNTRPMPKLTLGIEHYTDVPFTKGFLQVKGALSHGWFENTLIKNMYLHHKYAYLRIGGKWPVHLQYGLDHVCQWGGILPKYGQQPDSFSDYIAIFKGGHGGSSSNTGEQINALGNHIVSQSLKLEIDISDYKINGYWQNINEDPPVDFIWKNDMNKPDGLWGVSLKNNKLPFINGILYEYLNTTDQAGAIFQKDGIIYGGSDNYFSNYLYPTGWNYMSKTIGTPYIWNNKQKWPSSTNNRVCVQHVGIEGETDGYKYRLMASYSKNYGTYSAPFPHMIENTSTMLEIKKTYKQLYNIELGCTIGADFGGLYGNTLGCMLSIRKRGNLFKY